jgi:uncharacterized protein with PQ loop repeat
MFQKEKPSEKFRYLRTVKRERNMNLGSIRRKKTSFISLLFLLILAVSLVSLVLNVVDPVYKVPEDHVRNYPGILYHWYIPLLFSVIVLFAAIVLWKHARGGEDLGEKPLETVYRVLQPEEKLIVEAIEENGGVVVPQRKLCEATGLNKVRVHRIVRRLSEKGILQVEAVGHTNRILLQEWLRPNRGTE